MKLKREALAHYIGTSFDVKTAATSETWFRLGKDIEELSIELNPDTETTKNILGETSVKDNGYEPSASADPYYANPEDAIYSKVKDIAFDRLKGDACKTLYLEVIIDDTSESATYEGWVEEAVIKPQSYGGGTEGVNIPFDILFDGNRKKVSVKIIDGAPVVQP